MSWGVRVRPVNATADTPWQLARPRLYPGGRLPSRVIAQGVLGTLREQGLVGHVFEFPPPLVIVPRSEWGARAPLARTYDDWTAGVVPVLHHSAGLAPGETKARAPIANLRLLERAKAREIQRQHMRQGWSDIGYNWLVMPSGIVYEGRGYGIRGAHVAHQNTGKLGICIPGNYTTRAPSTAAVRSVWMLLDHLRERGADVGELVGHGDLMPTECPGDANRRSFGLRPG